MSMIFDATGMTETNLETPIPTANDFTAPAPVPMDLAERLAEAREAFADLPDGVVVWDIETRPIDDEKFRDLVPPFVPPPHPGEFDPRKVPLGNRKKRETIDAYLEEKRAEHQRAVEAYETTCQEAEQEHWRRMYERATLSPILGRVAAIGFADCDGEILLMEEDESRMLHALWEVFRAAERSHAHLVGFNSNRFDVPYCIRRSWLNDVPVPQAIRQRRYWSDVMIDLYEVWCMGKPEEIGGMDGLALAFGFRGKPEGMNGADFWKIMHTAPEVARAYLIDDLRMLAQLLVCMGISAMDVAGRSPLAMLRNAREGFRARLTNQATEAIEIADGIVHRIEQVATDDILQSIAAEAREIRDRIAKMQVADDMQRGRLLQLEAGMRRLIS